MTIVGSESFAIRSQPLSFNPATGRAIGSVYEGPRAVLETIIASLDAEFPYRLDDSNGPLCRLEVHTPEAGDVAVTFELLGNEIQKSLFEHSKTLNLDQATVFGLRGKTPQELYESTTFSTATGNLKQFITLLILGSDSYTEEQFVFRITQVVTRATTVSIGMSNIARIYSTNQLINETNPNAVLLAALASIDGNPSPLPVAPGYAYGWKKGTPTFQQVGFNRMAITIDYSQAVWSTYPYDLSEAAGSAAPNVPFV